MVEETIATKCIFPELGKTCGYMYPNGECQFLYYAGRYYKETQLPKPILKNGKVVGCSKYIEENELRDLMEWGTYGT